MPAPSGDALARSVDHVEFQATLEVGLGRACIDGCPSCGKAIPLAGTDRQAESRTWNSQSGCQKSQQPFFANFLCPKKKPDRAFDGAILPNTGTNRASVPVSRNGTITASAFLCVISNKEVNSYGRGLLRSSRMQLRG
jgi:hypothetical protein